MAPDEAIEEEKDRGDIAIITKLQDTTSSRCSTTSSSSVPHPASFPDTFTQCSKKEMQHFWPCILKQTCNYGTMWSSDMVTLLFHIQVDSKDGILTKKWWLDTRHCGTSQATK